MSEKPYYKVALSLVTDERERPVASVSMAIVDDIKTMELRDIVYRYGTPAVEQLFASAQEINRLTVLAEAAKGPEPQAGGEA